ncbi:MAG: helix-turn-helix domain-containing protein [Planctomycetia bacterium]|nr:helix-turn-helix domain-containing protein [Planctomycetia bacterium]
MFSALVQCGIPSSILANADAPTAAGKPVWASELEYRLEQLDAKITQLLQQRTIKDWYTTDEVAQLVKKAEFTVREWCRNGRVRAEKKGSGRGRYQSWVISHAEVQRIQKEGLLPPRQS